MNSETRDQSSDRLAFEVADDDLDSHVPALAIVGGIVGLIALFAAVQHLETIL